MLDGLGGSVSRSGGMGIITFPCGNEGQIRGGLLKVSRFATCICAFGSAAGISFLSLQNIMRTVMGTSSGYPAIPDRHQRQRLSVLKVPMQDAKNYPKGP